MGVVVLAAMMIVMLRITVISSIYSAFIEHLQDTGTMVGSVVIAIKQAQALFL